jgi:LuxR family transcriptional regulator, maltose regulon positive regulatory protein
VTTANEPVADAAETVAARTTFRRYAAGAAVVSRPGLWKRLGASARVTVVSAPPGSGKTVLLRSWIGQAGLAERAAWVPVERDERDPQRFWLSVLGALRQTSAGSALVRELTAAPDLDGWAITERLLMDLAPLAERLWLMIDDLHELASDQARRQLELLVMRPPEAFRFVLATRHDVRLGLHRLRLEGELTEIRADDLRFSPAEARALFAAAGVELSAPALALLVDRTEGWAAGLRPANQQVSHLRAVLAPPHAGARRPHTESRGGRYFSSRTAWPLSFRSSAITPRNLPVGKSKARTWC